VSGEPEGNTVTGDLSQVRHRLCGVVEPRHAWKLGALWARENRETLEPFAASKGRIGGRRR